MADSDFDLFDLCDLPFDPPPNRQKIRDAIEAKICEYKDEKQVFLMGIKNKLFPESLDDKGYKVKFDEEIRRLADERKKKALESLAMLARYLVESGAQDTYNKSNLTRYQNEFGIGESSVKDIFEKSGMRFVGSDSCLPAFYDFKTDLDKIHKALGEIRKKRHYKYGSASEVHDLYSLLAFLEGRMDEVDSYRKMGTDELNNIVEKFSNQWAFVSDKESIEYIFRSDILQNWNVIGKKSNAKNIYDSYLKVFNSLKLSELFKRIRSVPESLRLDDKLAQLWIKEIKTELSDLNLKDEEILAIYNKEAKLPKEQQYCPLKIDSRVYVKCPVCGKANVFESESDAMRIGQCGGCKRALYKVCGNCRRKILAYLDVCPHCKINFEAYDNRGKYAQALDNAIRSGDLKTVRSCVAKLKPCDDCKDAVAKGEAFIASETRRLEIKQEKDRLHDRISKEGTASPSVVRDCMQYAVKYRDNEFRALLDPCIKELENAYDLRNMAKVKALFDNLKPVLDASSARRYENFIESQGCIDELTRMQGRFSSEEGPDAQAISECMALYEKYGDKRFEALVKNVPPKPVKSVSASLVPMRREGNLEAYGTRLSWASSLEGRVNYIVVRKENSAPASQFDGTTVAKVRTTFFNDRGLEGGRTYYYSVFVERSGFPECVSLPTASLSVSAKPSVSDFTTRVSEAGVDLSFVKPSFCRSVIIRRTKQGSSDPKELARTYETSFCDRKCEPGAVYEYSVVCMYDVNGQEVLSKEERREVANVRYRMVTPDPARIDRSHDATKIRSDGELIITLDGDIPAGIDNFYFGVSANGKRFGLTEADISGMTRVSVADYKKSGSYRYGFVEGDSVHITLNADFNMDGKRHYYFCDEYECNARAALMCYVMESPSGLFSKKTKYSVQVCSDRQVHVFPVMSFGLRSSVDKSLKQDLFDFGGSGGDGFELNYCFRADPRDPKYDAYCIRLKNADDEKKFVLLGCEGCFRNASGAVIARRNAGYHVD